MSEFEPLNKGFVSQQPLTQTGYSGFAAYPVQAAHSATLAEAGVGHSSQYQQSSGHSIGRVNEGNFDSETGTHSHTPWTKIRWLQYLGVVLCVLMFAYNVFLTVEAYSEFKHLRIHSPANPFSAFYILQMVGGVLQIFNALQGFYAFGKLSEQGLISMGYSAGFAILWQFILTVSYLSWATRELTGTTISSLVMGWVPIITAILSPILRFQLLTWNVPQQFLCFEPSECQPAHCTPHQLEKVTKGCCSKVYKCNHCQSEWKR